MVEEKSKENQDKLQKVLQGKTGLVIAIVSGLIAVVLLQFYLRQKEKVYGSLEPVVIASKAIKAGEIFTNNNTSAINVPKSFLIPDAVPPNEIEIIIGKKSNVKLEKNQQISFNYVGITDYDEGLSVKLPYGSRAITLPFNTVQGVGGYLQPNDKVDIIGTFTMDDKLITKTLLQCVTIIAAGDNGSFSSKGYSSVTLNVTPEEAEMLLFAKQVSTNLHLVLRRKDDIAIDQDTDKIDFFNLMSEIEEQTKTRTEKVREWETVD